MPHRRNTILVRGSVTAPEGPRGRPRAAQQAWYPTTPGVPEVMKDLRPGPTLGLCTAALTPAVECGSDFESGTRFIFQINTTDFSSQGTVSKTLFLCPSRAHPVTPNGSKAQRLTRPRVALATAAAPTGERSPAGNGCRRSCGGSGRGSRSSTARKPPTPTPTATPPRPAIRANPSPNLPSGGGGGCLMGLPESPPNPLEPRPSTGPPPAAPAFMPTTPGNEVAAAALRGPALPAPAHQPAPLPLPQPVGPHPSRRPGHWNLRNLKCTKQGVFRFHFFKVFVGWRPGFATGIPFPRRTRSASPRAPEPPALRRPKRRSASRGKHRPAGLMLCHLPNCSFLIHLCHIFGNLCFTIFFRGWHCFTS